MTPVCCSQILAKSGTQVTSLRIGQICGGLPDGAWATSDWLPILVKSSVALGALPSATGFVSWLPMHTVSKTLVEIAFAADKLPEAINLKRTGNASDGDVQAIPAMKLLGFFRTISESDYVIANSGLHEVESGGLAKFATAKAQSLSQTMREVQPIEAQDVNRWVGYWRCCGFL
ncbi:hypothetical protein C0993_004656 [Termitomyces sp. T159_Od127]|nr:hypothetical protein C0993_004656 [Termitomyces sp. T159_Od127]